MYRGNFEIEKKSLCTIGHFDFIELSTVHPKIKIETMKNIHETLNLSE